jgi:RNA polymerase sigma-70 factor (ECF subfamily)
MCEARGSMPLTRSMTADREKPEYADEFLRLFAESSRSVYWLIRTSVFRQDAADEVFQETSAALWKKFPEFQSGTNFTAWAQQVARFEVLRYRQRSARDQKVFGEAFVDRVFAEVEQVANNVDHRRESLADCFAQLSLTDRDLINRRYAPGMTSKVVAQQLGRSESYISKALTRIHRLLFECISRREAGGGAE